MSPIIEWLGIAFAIYSGTGLLTFIYGRITRNWRPFYIWARVFWKQERKQ